MPGRFLSESRHDIFVIKLNGHPSERSEVKGSTESFFKSEDAWTIPIGIEA